MKKFQGDDLFEMTMEHVLLPFTSKVATLVQSAVQAEIVDQDIIDTGRFLKSITAEVNEEDLSIEVKPNLDYYIGMYYYPAALEFGTEKMAPRAPFRKSIGRVEEALANTGLKADFYSEGSEGEPGEIGLKVGSKK